MMQPFEKLSKKHLDTIISLKRMYLATQTYTRAFDNFADIHTIDILVTDYVELVQAQMHYNAFHRHDKYASIIDLTKPLHKSKIIEMLDGDKYSIYWSVVKTPESFQHRTATGYKDKIRRYIDSRTDWRIKGDETLRTNSEIIFGEIYITMSWRSKKLKVKFEEIERC